MAHAAADCWQCGPAPAVVWRHARPTAGRRATHHNFLAALCLNEEQQALHALGGGARPRAEALCHDVAGRTARHAGGELLAASRQQRGERLERLVERGSIAICAGLGQQRGCGTGRRGRISKRPRVLRAADGIPVAEPQQHVRCGSTFMRGY
jgi:hypothetical protein